MTLLPTFLLMSPINIYVPFDRLELALQFDCSQPVATSSSFLRATSYSLNGPIAIARLHWNPFRQPFRYSLRLPKPTLSFSLTNFSQTRLLPMTHPILL